MASVPRVDIRGLSHWFGNGLMRRQVLQSISLKIEPGEVVLLTGPSGGGKTTLLKVIAGLIEPTTGTVKVRDKEIIQSIRKK